MLSLKCFVQVVAVLLLSCGTASADVCSDLNALFARSSNFESARGSASGGRSWASKIGFAGAEECEINQSKKDETDFYLTCTIKRFSAKTDADKAYDQFAAQVKACAPAPGFKYSMNEDDDSKGIFFFNLDTKFSGNVSLDRMPDVSIRNGKVVSSDIFELSVAVYKAKTKAR
ncbi:methionyl-tRNA formyltransferase [Bradyrhizobium sp. USDA 3397]